MRRLEKLWKEAGNSCTNCVAGWLWVHNCEIIDASGMVAVDK